MGLQRIGYNWATKPDICTYIYIWTEHYIYIYIYTHTHTHTHIYIYIYTHTHTHVYILINLGERIMTLFRDKMVTIKNQSC